jgi:hypothetical protein
MPRNSSGTYSLPQAAFIAGTTIVAATMNSNLSDIALALTGSLAANGSTVITAPISFTPGTNALPSITFIGDTDTGIFSTGAGGLGISSNATTVISIAAGGATTFISSITANSIVSTTTVQGTTITATTALTAQLINNVTYTDTIVSATPSTPTATHLKTFVKLNNAATPIAKEYHVSSTGNIYPATGTFGQCRLTVSGGNLLLSPYNGNLITINDSVYIIPDAGVTLNRAGIADNTFFYIYLYDNAGVLTLEASATAYSSQASVGIKIKTGDQTRTLVGAAYSDVTSFKDTDGFLYTLSWFNRRKRFSRTTNTSTFTSTVTPTITEITGTGTELRCIFINWADEPVKADTKIIYQHTVGNAVVSGYLAYDSAVGSNIMNSNLLMLSPATGGTRAAINIMGKITEGVLTENVTHFITILYAMTTAGTFSAPLSFLTVIQVEING